MAKEEADTWQLDEPAARTHTPPGWPIKVIEFSASGKAPKKYGPNTYRFGASLTLSHPAPPESSLSIGQWGITLA